jgi:sulfur carrier protein
VSELSVVVNGEARTVQAPVSIAELVHALGLAGKRIAIERNGQIVPKSRYPQTRVDAGDRLEIVAAVGGG